MAAVVEFAGAGIEDGLLAQVVSGDSDRVDDGRRSLAGQRIVLLTDIAYAPDRLLEITAGFKRRGADWAGVFAMVGSEDPMPAGLELRTVLDLPITSASDAAQCEMCRLGVSLKPGTGLRDVRSSLGQYEPVVFWRLVSLMPEFAKVGHWPSQRTPNHFWLRVVMAEVLEKFGASMASRIVHVLETDARVLLRWIDAIVIAEDPESRALAQALQRTLRERTPEIVAVDRKVLHELSPRELGDEATAWVDEVRERIGPRANVLVVDQAAHHLRTYTALKALCDSAGWHTLAFCVVLDRTGIDSDLRERLRDSHYVSLYRWPFPPRLASSCPCPPAAAA
jgi:hypothetical protein